MSATGVSANSATRAGVTEVATALLPELPGIGLGTAEHIGGQMPEFALARSEDLLIDSCRANSAALLDGLIRSVPLEAMAPSVEVMRTTRAFVQRGLTLAAVMRGYRLGIAYWCGRWAEAVQRHCRDPEIAVATVGAGTAYLLGWLEGVTDRLADEARDEAERLAREGALARAEEIRRVLADPARNPDAASLRLGYELSGRHVAIVLRQDGTAAPDVPLEPAARELAARLSDGRPLIVRVDVATTWCWVPVTAAASAQLPDLPAPVLAGVGRPAVGPAGFRRSHREAQEAVRVAALARRAPGTVTRYEEIELASLCSGDPEWCRAFVAAELGPLAADDAATLRIRSTLEAFFAASSNFRATAKRLGVHHNTVRYRLAQAEALLGRPPSEGRLALEVALHLAGRLGSSNAKES
jgi:hypothetical protein